MAARRSPRNRDGGLESLASLIASGERVVLITGAGVSTSCGLPTYRHSATSVWASTTMSWGTRKKFQANPREWYDQFWLQRFPSAFDSFEPSDAHESIARVCARFPNVKVITQNIDGLHSREASSARVPPAQLVEIHGRVSAPRAAGDADVESRYPLHCKCVEEDSECPFASEKTFVATLPIVSVRQRQLDAAAEVKREAEPAAPPPAKSRRRAHVSTPRSAMGAADGSCSGAGAAAAATPTTPTLESSASAVPRCPGCGSSCPPQILQFDEDYESHDFYQYETARQWLRSARAFVLVGTSHAVWITEKAVRQARKRSRPVFNFNLDSNHVLARMQGLAVTNVLGKCEATLLELEQQCYGAHVAHAARAAAAAAAAAPAAASAAAVPAAASVAPLASPADEGGDDARSIRQS